MAIIYSGIGIFAIVFGLFFYFSYRDEKRERARYPLLTAFFVSVVFGLLITGVLLLIILAFTGSVNIANNLFDLSLNQKEVVFLVLGYILFGLIFEQYIVKIFLYYFGKSKIVYFISVSSIRFCFLLVMGEFLNIDNNVKISIIITLLVYLLDILSDFYNKNKKTVDNI